MDDRRGVRTRTAHRGNAARSSHRRPAYRGQVRRDNQYGPYIAGFVVVVAALAGFVYIGLNWATGPGRIAAMATPLTPTPAPTVVAAEAPPPPAPEAQPTPTTGEQVYVVKAGDSPSSIAQRFRVKTDDLVAYNHIEDPQRLQIGQTVKIPPPAAP
jgi:LysM repeat protein